MKMDYIDHGKDAQHDKLTRMLDETEANTSLPEIAREPYYGPNELSLSITRGGLLGAIGWYAGKLMGDAGDHPMQKIEKYRGSKGKTLGGLFAATGVLLGAFTASREVRDSKWAHRKMQKAVVNMYEQNVALKQELREQLKAREGEPNEARLGDFSADWGAKREFALQTGNDGKDTPQTHVQAAELEHQGEHAPTPDRAHA